MSALEDTARLVIRGFEDDPFKAPEQLCSFTTTFGRVRDLLDALALTAIPASPTKADGTLWSRLQIALDNRPGAGNLIGGKFIADPPATILADDLRAILAMREVGIPTTEQNQRLTPAKVDDGWVLVPREPSEEMLSAAFTEVFNAAAAKIMAAAIWKDMIAASPSFPALWPEVEEIARIIDPDVFDPLTDPDDYEDIEQNRDDAREKARALRARTERGFAKGLFTDHYGEKCSIQKSSIIEPEAIWLGIDDVAPIEGKYMGRMHLTQQHVRDLLPLLQHFAETGEMP